MSDPSYRTMFRFAALWNLAGSVFIVVFTPWIFRLDGLAPPQPAVYYQVWLGLCFVFGLGYYMVSRDMHGNRGIVMMGIAGKLMFCAVFGATFLFSPGQLPRFFLIVIAGDLWFTLRFAMFLKFASVRAHADVRADVGA